jgi:hypothetical protein
MSNAIDRNLDDDDDDEKRRRMLDRNRYIMHMSNTGAIVKLP